MNNKFEGSGKEVGKHYEYNGDYSEGQRTYGNLKWKDAGR